MDAQPNFDPQYPNRSVLVPLGPRPDLDEIIARRKLERERDAAAPAGDATGTAEEVVK